MYNIKFSDQALREIAESWDWYEEQQYWVGDKFKKAIARGVDAILKAPLRYVNKYADYREIQLKKFPFILIYQINEDANEIEIVSVFHTKRNPANKYK